MIVHNSQIATVSLFLAYFVIKPQNFWSTSFINWLSLSTNFLHRITFKSWLWRLRLGYLGNRIHLKYICSFWSLLSACFVWSTLRAMTRGTRRTNWAAPVSRWSTIWPLCWHPRTSDMINALQTIAQETKQKCSSTTMIAMLQTTGTIRFDCHLQYSKFHLSPNVLVFFCEKPMTI